MKMEQESTYLKAKKMMEGQSGTICSASNGKGSVNNGTCNQIDYRDTIDDNSTGNTSKGVKAGGTTNDIPTKEIIEGVKPGS